MTASALRDICRQIPVSFFFTTPKILSITQPIKADQSFIIQLFFLETSDTLVTPHALNSAFYYVYN